MDAKRTLAAAKQTLIARSVAKRKGPELGACKYGLSNVSRVALKGSDLRGGDPISNNSRIASEMLGQDLNESAQERAQHVFVDPKGNV